MSTSAPPIEAQDIKCPDLELSDSALAALARLLVDEALRKIAEDSAMAVENLGGAE